MIDAKDKPRLCRNGDGRPAEPELSLCSRCLDKVRAQVRAELRRMGFTLTLGKPRSKP